MSCRSPVKRSRRGRRVLTAQNRRWWTMMGRVDACLRQRRVRKGGGGRTGGEGPAASTWSFLVLSNLLPTSVAGTVATPAPSTDCRPNIISIVPLFYHGVRATATIAERDRRYSYYFVSATQTISIRLPLCSFWRKQRDNDNYRPWRVATKTFQLRRSSYSLYPNI